MLHIAMLHIALLHIAMQVMKPEMAALLDSNTGPLDALWRAYSFTGTTSGAPGYEYSHTPPALSS